LDSACDLIDRTFDSDCTAYPRTAIIQKTREHSLLLHVVVPAANIERLFSGSMNYDKNCLYISLDVNDTLGVCFTWGGGPVDGLGGGGLLSGHPALDWGNF